MRGLNLESMLINFRGHADDGSALAASAHARVLTLLERHGRAHEGLCAGLAMERTPGCCLATIHALRSPRSSSKRAGAIGMAAASEAQRQ